VDTINRVLELL